MKTHSEGPVEGSYDATDDRARAVRRLEFITIAWMSIELTVSLTSGFRANSVALVAFGGDSAVELLSALVVLRRFRLGPKAERNAAKLSSVLLYLLGTYIVVTSLLSFFVARFRPESSISGMILLAAAAVVMPILGAAKKQLARETGSAALRADSAQSNLCAYMSWISLAGLGLNWLFHLPSADSVAALCLLPIVLHEANEARKGGLCNC